MGGQVADAAMDLQQCDEILCLLGTTLDSVRLGQHKVHVQQISVTLQVYG